MALFGLQEGSDWFAVWNPKVKRVLDVNLVHTLYHERYFFVSLAVCAM